MHYSEKFLNLIRIHMYGGNLFHYTLLMAVPFCLTQDENILRLKHLKPFLHKRLAKKLLHVRFD